MLSGFETNSQTVMFAPRGSQLEAAKRVHHLGRSQTTPIGTPPRSAMSLSSLDADSHGCLCLVLSSTTPEALMHLAAASTELRSRTLDWLTHTPDLPRLVDHVINTEDGRGCVLLREAMKRVRRNLLLIAERVPNCRSSSLTPLPLRPPP